MAMELSAAAAMAVERPRRAARAGWLLLGEQLSLREIGGCVLVFAAILLAQMPPKQQ